MDVAAEYVRGRGWLKRKRSLVLVGDVRTEAGIEAANDLLLLTRLRRFMAILCKQGW